MSATLPPRGAAFPLDPDAAAPLKPYGDDPERASKSGDDVGPMDEDVLLDLLRGWEDSAADFSTGFLRGQRDQAVREYYQRPYGNEDEGWSSYVSSVVAETVEWALPDLLDVFVSNDKAVEFTPTRANELQDAKDATAGCNHVFYQQNNGFMILHTALKDMLIVKTCAVHTFAQTKRKRCRVAFKQQSHEAILLSMAQYAGKQPQIEVADPVEVPIMLPGNPPQPLTNPNTGQPFMQTAYTGNFTYVEEQKRVKVEAFEPEHLGVASEWTSPLLEDCPYVVRWMEISLSDLNELADDMGFDRVEASELASSQPPIGNHDDTFRRDRTANMYADTVVDRPEGIDRDDESQTMGWLRIEWVLVDYDGDGIAERREIWRLAQRVLSNEECPEVPIATGSLIPVPHRWDGQSAAETMSDLQLLDTELMRSVINNAYQASNPRKIVVTDKNWASLANIDDLLDGRPGGALRVQGSASNLQLEQTHFVAGDMEPILQRVDQLREQRSGVTKQRMGMDPNAIRPDRTLGETQIINDASKQRTKLMARVAAEVLVKPIFRSILRLLTSGGFDPLFFKLRGRFVTLDPNDWSDHYDLESNVGLGNGDPESVGNTLGGILNTQMKLAQSPLAQLVSQDKIYNTLARMVEVGGLRNSDEFFNQPPPNTPIPPPGPAPMDPGKAQIQIATINAQSKQDIARLQGQIDQAKSMNEANMKARDAANQNNIEAQNDQRDAQRTLMEQQFKDRLAAAELALKKYETDSNNRVKLYIARLASADSMDPADMDIDPSTGAPFLQDAMQPVVAALQQLYETVQAPATIVRHPQTGEIVGVHKAGRVQAVQRDANGNIVGFQQ